MRYSRLFERIGCILRPDDECQSSNILSIDAEVRVVKSENKDRGEIFNLSTSRLGADNGFFSCRYGRTWICKLGLLVSESARWCSLVFVMRSALGTHVACMREILFDDVCSLIF